MDRLHDYLMRSAAVLDGMAQRDFSTEMDRACEMIVSALRAGRPLLTCGNGGSAADALHIAGELVGRFTRDRRGFNVIALPADVATLTAWSNDKGFEHVFERQVEAYGGGGGVLLALSTSGNSRNVVLAIDKARDMGLGTIGMTGSTGGALTGRCDVLFNVAAETTPLVQQGHACLYHHLCDQVEERLSGT